MLAIFLENNNNNTKKVVFTTFVWVATNNRNKPISFDAILIRMKFANDGNPHIQFQHSRAMHNNKEEPL